MDFISDTDVMSMLGKIDRIALFEEIFLKSEIIRELQKAKEYGFSFSDDLCGVVNFYMQHLRRKGYIYEVVILSCN